MVRVVDVTKVQIGILKSLPPKCFIFARGRVSTTGWSNPQLGPWYYLVPPEDGIQDFDFYATPPQPGTIVIQVFRSIQTDILIDRDPYNYWGPGQPLKGVRIHAATNEMVETLTSGARASEDDKTEAGPFGVVKIQPLGGDWVPWPWTSALGKGSTTLTDPIGLLIGHPVRKYRQGSPITDDYIPDRVNIVVDNDERIIDVKFG